MSDSIPASGGLLLYSGVSAFKKRLLFFPSQISFDAYKALLVDSNSILRGYFLSFVVTVTGTLSNIVLTLLFAYPLSRRDLPGKGFFSFMVFFTMLFNGGLVPTYMMWTGVFNIKNTLWALIVPNLMMGAFYVIMMRTYFTTNIPEAVLEAARIDGAGELKMLVQIVLPMSKPILATIVLLVGLNYWNDWLNGLYYVNDDRLYSIQVLLNKMLMDVQYLMTNAASSMSQSIHARHGHQDGCRRDGRTPHVYRLSLFSEIFCAGYCDRRRKRIMKGYKQK